MLIKCAIKDGLCRDSQGIADSSIYLIASYRAKDIKLMWRPCWHGDHNGDLFYLYSISANKGMVCMIFSLDWRCFQVPLTIASKSAPWGCYTLQQPSLQCSLSLIVIISYSCCGHKIAWQDTQAIICTGCICLCAS